MVTSLFLHLKHFLSTTVSCSPVFFFLIAELHRARGTRELSPIAKKIWLSIHLRKFGSHMTLCPSTRTGSQWSLSSVDLEFRLRQKTLKDIFFRMCL